MNFQSEWKNPPQIQKMSWVVIKLIWEKKRFWNWKLLRWNLETESLLWKLNHCESTSGDGFAYFLSFLIRWKHGGSWNLIFGWVHMSHFSTALIDKVQHSAF